MIFTKVLDVYSILRFVLCYAAVATLVAISGFPLGISCIFILIAGVGLEALDEFNWKKGWKVRFLDPNGGNWRDALVSFAGVALAYIVF